MIFSELSVLKGWVHFVRYDIRQISLDTNDFTDLVLPAADDVSAIAVDFDPIDKKVFWIDEDTGIHRASLDQKNAEDIVTEEVPKITFRLVKGHCRYTMFFFQLNRPDGLAIDWLARNLFWTDTGSDTISVSRLDGSNRRVLISRGLDEPRAIVLDPLQGWMYWSDWGEDPRIERAWMNGENRMILVDSGIGWPNGLALDAAEGKIYWCDAKTDRIEVANVDGSGRRVVLQDVLPHPFGLTLRGGSLYWTDWNENVVQAADKTTGDDRAILVAHLKDLMGLRAASYDPEPEWSNECSTVPNGGCSHLCLMTPRGRTCQCPDADGFELDEDGKSCLIPEAFILYTHKNVIGRLSLRPNSPNDYALPIRDVSDASAIDFDRYSGRIYWTDIEEKTISRSYLNGSSSEVIAEFGLDFPDGMAVDWSAQNIYWTDMSLGRIEVARTDGHSRRVIVWRDLSRPSSIAVDPEGGRIFWSSWGEIPLIESAFLDGSNRDIFRSDVGRANGLVIDFNADRIYWTDLDGGSVSFCSLNGANAETVTIVRSSPRPYGLTLYGGHIYWADWKLAMIKRADKDTGENQVTVRSNITELMDLMVFHESLQLGANDCKVSNGGCDELCLYVNGRARCVCPSHFQPDSSGTKCLLPEDFIVFCQKNKISRLITNDEEVPDVILPIRSARDIRALSFDVVRRVIYWVDSGSKRKEGKFSIKRAFHNGTSGRRLLQGSAEDGFEPVDLAVDSVNRLLFWSCSATNSINITRLDEEDIRDSNLGVVISGEKERPRSIALHPKRRFVFQF